MGGVLRPSFRDDFIQTILVLYNYCTVPWVMFLPKGTHRLTEAPSSYFFVVSGKNTWRRKNRARADPRKVRVGLVCPCVPAAHAAGPRLLSTLMFFTARPVYVYFRAKVIDYYNNCSVHPAHTSSYWLPLLPLVYHAIGCLSYYTVYQ